MAKKLPELAIANSLVLQSGLTSQMDARDLLSFVGLQEMIGGIKKCLERPPVYVVATSPVDDIARVPSKSGVYIRRKRHG